MLCKLLRHKSIPTEDKGKFSKIQSSQIDLAVTFLETSGNIKTVHVRVRAKLGHWPHDSHLTPEQAPEDGKQQHTAATMASAMHCRHTVPGLSLI